MSRLYKHSAGGILFMHSAEVANETKLHYHISMKRDSSAQLLREHGQKCTPTRLTVLQWCFEYDGVFSAQDVLDYNKTLDKVSVYRTLELFSELDIIHPIALNDQRQYYELHEKKHHHHIVCEGCNMTACIDCPVKKVQNKNFSSIHHSFIMTGVCNACV